MDLPEISLELIRLWATRTDSVREIWLFGSRAKGTARPDSDIDLAIILMPAKGKDDWALGNYFALAGEWQRELATMLKQRVSLQGILPGTPKYEVVMDTGILLWQRT
jgi:predicted nucleotidyltransferase